MKLTKLIFDYWKVWMRQPKGCVVTPTSISPKSTYITTINPSEGVYFPAHSKYPLVQFWWCLNIGWYKMNNKSHARTLPIDVADKFPFVCPEDFEGIL